MSNQFEFVKAFNSEDLNSWKNNIVEDEKSRPQDQSSIEIDRIDLSKYVQSSSYHYNNHTDTSHKNSPSVHSDNGGYSQDYFAHENGHRPMPADPNGEHIDGIYGYYTDTWYNPQYGQTEKGDPKPVHKDYYNSKHYDYHNDSGGGLHTAHSNAGWEHANVDRPRHNDAHSDGATPHSDTPYSQSGHYNYVPHSDYTLYNQQHVNHDNYIPSAPKFFNLDEENPSRLFGVTTIEMFSFDGNVYGLGSDWKISKTVEYKIEMRKISKLDGTPDISSWVTLRDYSTEESYQMNSLDPFKVGNLDPSKTNGNYEIRVTPRNPSYTAPGYPTKTYDFVGDSKTVKVYIEQNNDPELTVTNPSEFIKFTFGKDNSLNTSKDVKSYDEYLYKNAPIDCIKGIFVEISALELDTRDYLKGNAKLISSKGSILSASDIVWSNGSSVIKSNGGSNSGYVFFPLMESLSLSNTHDENAIVEIVLSDFLDESCTKPSGSTIIQKSISKSNNTLLNVDLDTLSPNITGTPSTTQWTNKDVILSIIATDKSGISYVENPDKSIRPGSTKNNSLSYTYSVSDNGDYKFTCSDGVGNITSKVIKVSNIDKVPPVISANKSGSDKINLIIYDELSGLRDGSLWYQLSSSSEPNLSSGWISASSSMTIPIDNEKQFLHVKASDNAGNSTYKVIGPFVIADLMVTAVKDLNWRSEVYPIKYNTTDFPIGANYKFLDNEIKLGYSINFNIKGISNYDSMSCKYSFLDDNGSPLVLYSDDVKLEDLDLKLGTGYTLQKSPSYSEGDISYFKHFIPANAVVKRPSGELYSGMITVKATLTVSVNGKSFNQDFYLYCVNSNDTALDDLYIDKQR